MGAVWLEELWLGEPCPGEPWLEPWLAELGAGELWSDGLWACNREVEAHVRAHKATTAGAMETAKLTGRRITRQITRPYRQGTTQASGIFTSTPVRAPKARDLCLLLIPLFDGGGVHWSRSRVS